MSQSERLHDDCLSIAPMIQWTDRYWRFLMRQITRKTVLYTEMTMDNAIVYNASNLEPFLGHDPVEYPLVLQLGGNNPSQLAEAAYLSQSYGNYREINLNCGCPSNRAKKCGFGAELMLEPDLVRQICYEMRRRVTNSEITVKCRLGVTGKDSFEDLLAFISAVRSTGVKKVILHARSCVLRGLSPAQNRTIPPLHPEVVHQVQEVYPDLQIVMNGGVTSFAQAKAHLGLLPSPSEEISLWPPVSGVMLGREAYHNPFLFATADEDFFHSRSPVRDKSKLDLLHCYLDYAETMKARNAYGSNTCNLVKPLHHFFHHHSNNGEYKRRLDDCLKQHSKAVDRGEMPLQDLVLEAVTETIPREELEALILSKDHNNHNTSSSD